MATTMGSEQVNRIRDHEQASGQFARDQGGTEFKRWASVLGGGALTAYGLAKRSPGGLGLAVVGGTLAYRGLAGPLERRSLFSEAQRPGVHVEQTMTILRPAEELYRYWRNLENLPRFM